ncbi:MAG: hypothetical protein WD295_01380, partial [Bacteroidota bacterium]
MKHHARMARVAGATGFDFPRPPAAPTVAVTELDEAIILEWGSDHRSVSRTENVPVAGTHKFEGYSIYQYSSANTDEATRVRVATFDRINAITNIVDQRYDPASGLIVPTTVQRGTNSGIQRHIRITKDLLKSSSGFENLRNGTTYYFAVTAYNYSDALSTPQQSFESIPVVLPVVPRIPFGVQPIHRHGDTLQISRVSGSTEATVKASVIDPTKGNGASYEIGFILSEGEPRWRLRLAGTETVVGAPQPVVTPPEKMSIVVAGVEISMSAPVPGINTWSWFPSANRFLTWVGGQMGLEGFNGAAGWASPRSLYGDGVKMVRADQLRRIEIRFAPTSDNLGNFDPSDPNASYAYRYGINFDQPTVQPGFGPWIVNAAGGFAYQDYMVSLPLAVYDVDGRYAGLLIGDKVL